MTPPTRLCMIQRTARSLALVVAVLLPMAAGAQPQMPDLRSMSGKPLPVPDLPPGTVTVRVARQAPSNPVTAVEVTALLTTKSGEGRKRTAQTGDDGRATFESVPAGSTFKAEVTVDGERLQTDSFSVPPQGGTRIMLIAGLGADGAGPDESFKLGAVAGTVGPMAGMPPGTLEITLRAADGTPIVDRELRLGMVAADNSVKVLRERSDAQGLVRMKGLPTGEGTGFAAVMEQDGMRFNTEPFRMPTDMGVGGELRVLGRTSDPSVLSVTAQSKVVLVEPLEDGLHIGENIVFVNSSEKIFDPGEAGLLIPMPKGVTSGRAGQRGSELEFKPNEGFLFKGTVPPSRAAVYATEAQFEFVVPGQGGGRLEFRQPMPFAMKTPLVLLPTASGLSIEATGMRKLRDDTDSQGNKVLLYELPDIAAGGTLAMNVSGLPKKETSGRTLAGILCALLIGAAVVGARQPKRARDDRKSRDDLLARREKLFGELVTLEEGARKGAPDSERRAELVGKLEIIYRDLGRLEHGEPIR